MARKGWEVTHSPALGGYLVRIGGELVLNEDGKPSVYYLPKDFRDYDQWRGVLRPQSAALHCNIDFLVSRNT